MSFYDIIGLISVGMCIPPRKGHRPGRNIPATILRNANTTFTGNTTTISKRRATWLRDARTRLGRLLVFMYSSLACGRATGEYMRREQALHFHVCETVSAAILSANGGDGARSQQLSFPHQVVVGEKESEADS